MALLTALAALITFKVEEIRFLGDEEMNEDIHNKQNLLLGIN